MTSIPDHGWAGDGDWPGNPFVYYVKLDAKDKLRVLLMSIFVVPARLVLMSVALLFAYIFSLITLANCKNFDSEPLKGWRKTGKDLVLKCFLLAHIVCGFHRVRISGKRAAPWEAPILVFAPHSSLIDTLPVAFIGAPSFVGKSGLMKIPIISRIFMVTQPIFVDRDKKDCRKMAIEKIRERSRLLRANKDSPDCNGWPQIAIFPEATTTDRSQIISFKPGAFLPQLPVQPVCLRWPNTPDTITWPWEGTSCLMQFWLTLCQFENRLEIEFLPVHIPNEAERNDALLYARNVRARMANCLDLPTSDYTWEDARFFTRGHNPDRTCFMKLCDELNIPYSVCDDLALEDAWCRQLQGTRWSHLNYKIIYEHFARDFCRLPPSPKLQRLFNMFDWTCTGVIDLREFIIAQYANTYSYSSMKLCFEMFRDKDTGTISPEDFVRILRIPCGISLKRCKKLYSLLMDETSAKGTLFTIDALQDIAEKHNEPLPLCQFESNNNRFKTKF